MNCKGIGKGEFPQELAKVYLTFAEVYAQAGMKTQAIVYLRKALSVGQRRQQLQQNPQLAALRGDPEFEPIVATRHKM